MKNILQVVVLLLMFPIMCLGGVFGLIWAAFASGQEYMLNLLIEIFDTW